MYIFISFLIIALDQISKFLITSFIPLGREKEIIGNILSFTYIRNEGAAFGILHGARLFFILFTLVAFALASFYIFKTRPDSPLEKTALSFIAGGALGNFADRIVFGYVRDFIMTVFIDFPIFNVADIFVCIGAFLYVIYAFFPRKEGHKNE